MHPVLIKVGPVTIYTYGVFLAIAFIVGIYISEKRAEKEGINKKTILNTGFVIFLFGLVGARLVYVISNLSFYFSCPWDIFIGRAGFIFHGGILFATIASLIYLKRNFLKVVDIMAPSFSIGISIGRIGCLFEGCCYGKPTSLPWAITFPEKSHSFLEFGKVVPLHPTQIYESLGCLVLFFVLLKIKPKKEGEVFFSFLIGYSIIRFFIEILRSQPILFLGLTQPQVFFVIAFILSIILLKR